MEVIERDEEFRIRLCSGDTLFARKLSGSMDYPEGSFQARIEGGHGIVLIIIHGGPGLADHTESFPGLQRALVECRWDCGGSPCGGGGGFYGGIMLVIFYDQLDCGRSDKPPKDDKYSLAMYVDKLDQVIMHVAERHKDNGRRYPMICLLGHSWGSQIVLELFLSPTSYDSLGCLSCAVVSNTPNGTCRSAVLEGADHGPFFGDGAELYFCSITDFLLEVSLAKQPFAKPIT